MTLEIVEMSAVSETAHDPFYDGWRDVRRRYPNGREEIDRVPLTREDILHPQEEDCVTHTDDHQRFCVYLYNVLRGLFLNNPHMVVLHDVLVGWDVPGLRGHGPDIAVIFGVRERRNWSTFHVAEEGVRPALIIEVTSPKTREIDLVDKVDHYERADVPYYVMVDSHEHKGVLTRRLLGYQMTPQGYAVLPPDARGWLWMAPVGLWIGIRDNEVECYDQAGNLIEDYEGMLIGRTEAEARAETAEARAEAEAQARAAAEAHLADLEAELRRLRGDG